MMSTQNPQTMSSGSSGSQPQHKAFTGRVTKLLDNFGFVDDDVFFQLSVVRGGNVKVGDQVYVECQYSEHLPFKWNAIRLQILPQQTTVNSTYLQRDTNIPQAQSYYPHDVQQPPQVYQSQGQSTRQPQLYASDYKQQPPPQAPAQPQPLQQQQQQQQPQQQAFSEYYPKQAQATYSSSQPAEYSSSSPNFQQITYTSTPGAAFVSTQIMPFTPQVAASQAQPQTPVQPPGLRPFVGRDFKGASRWDEPRNREDPRIARRDEMRFNEREREREQERERERDRERDRERERERDRERLRERERIADRDRERERDRYGRDKERSLDKPKEVQTTQANQRSRRSTESPGSTTSSTAHRTRDQLPPRRRYEPVNVPKFSVLKPILSSYDVKQRYGPGIRIPSDFKEVQVNSCLNLNIQEIPKPIKYKILDIKEDVKADKPTAESKPKTESLVVNEKHAKSVEKPEKSLESLEVAADEIKVEKEKEKENDKEKDKGKDKEKEKEQEKEKEKEREREKEKYKKPTKEVEASSQNGKDSKTRNHAKYAVKVALISLPTMSDIYDRVFGSDHDSHINSKAYFLHLNRLVSILCSRNQNEGHALVGGKFSLSLDGFIEGTEQPNLIATAVRCVKQQTGIDLSRCRRWKHIATFAYNRDDSIIAEAPLDFSCVYMPDVWSLLESELDAKVTKEMATEENALSFSSSAQKAANSLIGNNAVVTSVDKNETKESIINKHLENSVIPLSSLCPTEAKSSHKQEDVPAEDERLLSSAAISVTPPLGSSTALSSDCAMDLSSASHDTNNLSINLLDSEAVVNNNPINNTDLEDGSNGLVVDTSTSDFDSSGTQLIVNKKSEDCQQPMEEDGVEAPEVKAESDVEPHGEGSSGSCVSEKRNQSEKLQLLLRINDLKVTELKGQLDQRNVKYKHGIKKAELVAKLKQLLQEEVDDEDVVSDSVKGNWWALKIMSKEEKDKERKDSPSTSHPSGPSETQAEAAVGAEDVPQDSGLEDKKQLSITSTASSVNDAADEMIVKEEKKSSGETQADPSLSHGKDKVGSAPCAQGQRPSPTTFSASKETEKRKRDLDDDKGVAGKRKCLEETKKQIIENPISDGFILAYGGSSLTVASLFQALSRQKYDHFELTIIAELLREALIHHFTHYILSTLIHNQPLKCIQKEDSDEQPKKGQTSTNLYVKLAFSYFDSCHCGYLLAEDLLKTLHNCGFNVSKKGWTSLLGDNDKLFYIPLQEPFSLIDYRTVEPFSSATTTKTDAVADAGVAVVAPVFLKDGNIFNVQQLIDQSEQDEKIKNNLREKLKTLQKKLDQQIKQVSDYESRQKKMTQAIEKQNDEICSLKRDKESFKVKYEDIRKNAETCVTTFSETLKKHGNEK